MEYNKKCISSRFLKLTYPTFKPLFPDLANNLNFNGEFNVIITQMNDVKN